MGLTMCKNIYSFLCPKILWIMKKYLKRSFLFQKILMDKNLKYLCVSVGVEMKSTIFSYPHSYHQAIADISESNKTNISYY